MGSMNAGRGRWRVHQVLDDGQRAIVQRAGRDVLAVERLPAGGLWRATHCLPDHDRPYNVAFIERVPVRLEDWDTISVPRSLPSRHSREIHDAVNRLLVAAHKAGITEGPILAESLIPTTEQQLQRFLNDHDEAFVGCDLRGIDLERLHMTSLSLAGSDLREASLRGSFTTLDIRGADLRGVRDFHIRATHIDARYADLRDVDFTRVRCTGIDLTGALLDGASGVDALRVDPPRAVDDPMPAETSPVVLSDDRQHLIVGRHAELPAVSSPMLLAGLGCACVLAWALPLVAIALLAALVSVASLYGGVRGSLQDPDKHSLLGQIALRNHAPLGDDPPVQYAVVVDEQQPSSPLLVRTYRPASSAASDAHVVERVDRVQLTGDTASDAMVCSDLALKAERYEHEQDDLLAQLRTLTARAGNHSVVAHDADFVRHAARQRSRPLRRRGPLAHTRHALSERLGERSSDSTRT